MTGFGQTLLRCLASSLLLHARQGLAKESLSGTVEVDLIFPKNGDAYEPTAMMPLVWAVQNANLAATLDAIITIKLTAPELSYPDELELHLTPANLTGKDVYYAYTYSDKFNVEGSFGINWYLYYKNQNCSRSIYYNNDGSDFEGFVDLSMSTKQSAPMADIVAAHSSNCSNTENISFNITGTQSSYASHSNSTSEMCGLLSPTRPALDAGKPCNVKVDAAAASSITASLQAAVIHDQCAAGHPTPSCPAKNTAEGLHVQFWRKHGALVFLAAVVAVGCM